MRGYIEFANRPRVASCASSVGKKEKNGPLGVFFDDFSDDPTFGEKTWELAESRLQQRALERALERGGLKIEELDAVFGGDLQAQCTATHYALRSHDVPFVGMYGACSTMAQSLAVSASFVNAGYAQRAAALTSSHFCAAERQFRFPLEYGSQRTPTSQWTCTAAGCVILSRTGRVGVKSAMLGRIADFGVNDINNMGAAMAPAAADTLARLLRASNTQPEDYDFVVTGDLGEVGSSLLSELLSREDIKIRNHFDCGMRIFERDDSFVKAGGSGCGCSASVLCSYFMPKLENGDIKRIIFCATGALMSTVSFQQKQSIPSIAHAVVLERF